MLVSSGTWLYIRSAISFVVVAVLLYAAHQYSFIVLACPIQCSKLFYTVYKVILGKVIVCIRVKLLRITLCQQRKCCSGALKAGVHALSLANKRGGARSLYRPIDQTAGQLQTLLG